MATIASLAPFVEIKARNVPTPNVHHALREAVIAFMRMSRAAVDEVYVDVRCSERELVLVPKACHALVQVEAIYEDPGCRTRSRWNPDWLLLESSEMTQGGWWIDDVGGPNATVWIPPHRDKRRMCVRYSWSIKRDDCEIPDWMYQDYATFIADGALSYLHNNPSDEYASRPFGGDASAGFMAGVEHARRRKEGQYRHRQLSMHNTGFFMG
jgi:hypothetical protein